MPKYEIDIFWSEEDDAFIAVVPDLPGCSAWGDTREEALQEVQVAMQLYLETLQEEGRPFPTPTPHTAVR